MAVAAPRKPPEGATGHTDWQILEGAHTADAPVAAPAVALVFVRADHSAHVVRSPGSLAGDAARRIHRLEVVGSWAYHVDVEAGRRDWKAVAMVLDRRESSGGRHSRRVNGMMRKVGSAEAYVDLLDATGSTAGRMLEAQNCCTLLSDLHWSSRNFGCAGPLG